MAKNILITGGAGYIGSFMIKRLMGTGYYPIVLDNLSNGYESLILYGKFISGDVGDKQLVTDIIKTYRIEDAIHFAAHSSIKESFDIPGIYMNNNLEKSRVFFEVCAANKVRNIIYSSSCAVYGIPDDIPIREDSPLQPINPYGETKVKAEEQLKDIARRAHCKYAILRYFNVVGADSQCKIGEISAKNGRLFKLAAETITGKRDAMYIFGVDYDTPDGTAVRDYVHVEDIVDAHFAVLHYLKEDGESGIFNIGYGSGWSVKEIIQKFLSIGKVKIKVIEKPRRVGDPPYLISDSSKIKRVIGWQAKHDNIDMMIESTLKWELKLKLAKEVPCDKKKRPAL